MTAPLPLRLLLPLTTITAYSSSSDFPSKPLKSFHSASPNFNLSYSSSLSSHHHTCAGTKTPIRSKRKWLCGHRRRDQDVDSPSNEDDKGASMFDSDEEVGTQIPTQAQSVVEGSGAVLVSEFTPVADVDYLQELLAIQQQGPRAIGFFGTRNMGFMHQELIEILSYAMVITKNHIYTSGASGTNAAVIRGALRAEKPELLTVILPQSLKKQPPESQELLSKVKNVIEKPYNDHLPLLEASRFLCAVEPEMRSAWARKIRDILKPDGELITLMFPMSDHIGKPPYKVSVSDYEEVLHPMGFKATSVFDNELAVPPRKGREKLERWKRSLSKSSLWE